MGDNIKRGNYGEQLACDYLEKNNIRIIEKNYRCNFGEIDIIVEDKGYLVFVEVKYRKSLKFGRPREAVGAKKQLHIKKTAIYYMKHKNIVNKDIRFDVVEVLHIENIEIEHIKNAF
jgi:putative endonuclease